MGDLPNDAADTGIFVNADIIERNVDDGFEDESEILCETFLCNCKASIPRDAIHFGPWCMFVDARLHTKNDTPQSFSKNILHLQFIISLRQLQFSLWKQQDQYSRNMSDMSMDVVCIFSKARHWLLSLRSIHGYVPPPLLPTFSLFSFLSSPFFKYQSSSNFVLHELLPVFSLILTRLLFLSF